MPLDIALFREDQEGNPNVVRESQQRRYKPASEIERVFELDAMSRKSISGHA